MDYKLVFKINLSYAPDDIYFLKISIIKISPVITNYKYSNLYNINNYSFYKRDYFLLESNKCTLPREIKPDSDDDLYSHTLFFNSDEDRKKFLLRFKNHLIRFVKSSFFKKDLIDLHGPQRIKYNDNYWIIY